MTNNGRETLHVGQRVRLRHPLVGDGYLEAGTEGQVTNISGRTVLVRIRGITLTLDWAAVEPVGLPDLSAHEI
jgi:hypothetical protein